MARLATRKAKPNGQYYVTESEAASFLRDIAVTSLPGVGRSLREKLAQLGVLTCGDLQQVTLRTLQKQLGGKTGLHARRVCDFNNVAINDPLAQ